jgi:hypothetical protein
MASELGKDDDKYVALMDQYKMMRMKDGKGAMKFLDAAMKLRKEGDVSDDAMRGGAYL